jgi:hypothetical protein
MKTMTSGVSLQIKSNFPAATIPDRELIFESEGILKSIALVLLEEPSPLIETLRARQAAINPFR